MIEKLKRLICKSRMAEVSAMYELMSQKILFVAEVRLQDSSLRFVKKHRLLNPEVSGCQKAGELMKLCTGTDQTGRASDFRFSLPYVVSELTYKKTCDLSFPFDQTAVPFLEECQGENTLLLTFFYPPKKKGNELLEIVCQNVDLQEMKKTISAGSPKESSFPGKPEKEGTTEKTEKEKQPVKTVKRVLMAEDEEYNLETLCEYLDAMGICHDECYNGAELLRIFEDSPEGFYDMILLDMSMPVMDGLEAVRILRQMDREDADVLIIAVSGDISEAAVKDYRAAGVNGYLGKPFSQKTLEKAMEQVLYSGQNEGV
ncbi:MAG: response regulator [Anaerovoracaceae bacterium]